MFAVPVPSPSSLRTILRFATLLLPMALAACVSTQGPPQQAVRRIDPAYVAMYGPRPDEPYPLPATDITEVDPRFLRREVAYYGRGLANEDTGNVKAAYADLKQAASLKPSETRLGASAVSVSEPPV